MRFPGDCGVLTRQPEPVGVVSKESPGITLRRSAESLIGHRASSRDCALMFYVVNATIIRMRLRKLATVGTLGSWGIG